MLLKQFYCTRCAISFRTFFARLQHIYESPYHHICYICFPPQDFAKMVELDEHLGTEHNYCISCDIQFETAQKLAQHDIGEHNMCVICRQFFGSRSSLSNVSLYLTSHYVAGKILKHFIAHDHPHVKAIFEYG